jgi:hypothetical protein
MQAFLFINKEVSNSIEIKYDFQVSNLIKQSFNKYYLNSLCNSLISFLFEMFTFKIDYEA